MGKFKPQQNCLQLLVAIAIGSLKGQKFTDSYKSHARTKRYNRFHGNKVNM